MTQSHLERALEFQIRVAGLPEPEREYRFWPGRRFRFDFAWPDKMIAVEVEGGQWVRGRHQRGAGFAADTEKYNEAAILGWCVLRFPTNAINSGRALATLERALDGAE